MLTHLLNLPVPAKAKASVLDKQRQGAVHVSPETFTAMNRAYLDANRVAYMDYMQSLHFPSPKEKLEYFMTLQDSWKKAEHALTQQFDHTENTLKTRLTSMQVLDDALMKRLHQPLIEQAEAYDYQRYFTRSYHEFLKGLAKLGERKKVSLESTPSQEMFQIRNLKKTRTPEAALVGMINFKSPKAQQKTHENVLNYIHFVDNINKCIQTKSMESGEILKALPTFTRYYSEVKPLMNHLLPVKKSTAT